MLVKTALVGKGKKWHIARSKYFTYCGAKTDWVSDKEIEISEIEDLCANCSNAFRRTNNKKE